MTPPAWHALEAGEALARLRTSSQGLTEAEAATRLLAHGPNRLPEARRLSPAMVFLRQFRSPLIYVLLGACLISAVLRAWDDAVFILAVVLIDAGLGAWQEWRAETGAAALRKILRLRPTVLRDGVRRTVDVDALVPGDIVLLESGAAAPADLRLLSVHALRVDESLLTGESEAIDKRVEAVAADTPLADRGDMVLAGTLVLAGRGAGVVCATGAGTELGKVARGLAGADAPPPLLLRLRGLSRRIAAATGVVVVVIGLGLFARGGEAAEVLSMTIALAVSAIPEGLPVAVTVALAIASARMARRQVIVRRLPAVEGLGSCTLIASDKTGTLTENRLTVQRLALPDGSAVDVGGRGLALEGALDPEPTPARLAALRRLAAAGALANEAHLRQGEDGAVEAGGDTVDVAFLVLAAKLGLDRDVPGARPRDGLLPYEPRFGFSASLDDGRITVKGAPERVLAMCEGVDDAVAAETVRRLACDGYRVIALAEGAASEPGRLEGRHLRGLTLLGFAGLIDPVRPEAPEAVARCRAAGVDVRMVTGDHPDTALAIARRIWPDGRVDDVVTGAELAALSGEALQRRIREAEVFARVEPGQKTQIVQALQAAGHFVAVTGDGVNDAPALRAANIGVAMGAGGTDVARAAAELVIADDNFASIVAGVEEGRTAYANIRKIVWLLISTAVAEVLLFALALLTGLPMPLTTVQILWLNLVHEGIQDVALAMEGKEPDVMARPPRPPGQSIFDRRMIEQCLLTGAWLGVASFLVFAWLIGEGGRGLDAARNLTLLFLILFDNVHVLNCRSETRSALRIPLRANPVLLTAVVGAPLVHLLAMNLPGLSDVLGIAPVAVADWVWLGALAATALLVGEAYKAFRARPRAVGAIHGG